MFYLISTLYPLVARATYPALGFPQYPGEVDASDAAEDAKAEAQRAAAEAIAQPLEAYSEPAGDVRGFIASVKAPAA
jgi:glutathione S-transferase